MNKNILNLKIVLQANLSYNSGNKHCRNPLANVHLDLNGAGSYCIVNWTGELQVSGRIKFSCLFKRKTSETDEGAIFIISLCNLNFSQMHELMLCLCEIFFSSVLIRPNYFAILTFPWRSPLAWLNLDIEFFSHKFRVRRKRVSNIQQQVSKSYIALFEHLLLVTSCSLKAHGFVPLKRAGPPLELLSRISKLLPEAMQTLQR